MAKKLAKKDYDKDGKVEAPTKEYMGVKDRAIKHATRNKKAPSKRNKKAPSKRNKKVLKDSVEVSEFITAISVKNYAQATKYLKGIIESKIQNRINLSLNEPLF